MCSPLLPLPWLCCTCCCACLACCAWSLRVLHSCMEWYPCPGRMQGRSMYRTSCGSASLAPLLALEVPLCSSMAWILDSLLAYAMTLSRLTSSSSCNISKSFWLASVGAHLCTATFSRRTALPVSTRVFLASLQYLEAKSARLSLGLSTMAHSSCSLSPKMCSNPIAVLNNLYSASNWSVSAALTCAKSSSFLLSYQSWGCDWNGIALSSRSLTLSLDMDDEMPCTDLNHILRSCRTTGRLSFLGCPWKTGGSGRVGMSSSSSSVIAKGLLYIWVILGVENSRSHAPPEAGVTSAWFAVRALLDAELTLISVSAGLLPAKRALLREWPIH